MLEYILWKLGIFFGIGSYFARRERRTPEAKLKDREEYLDYLWSHDLRKEWGKANKKGEKR